MEPEKQTKRQKKALAFRANKGKGKNQDQSLDQLETPEVDDLDAEERVVVASTSAVKGGEGKKRKREEDKEKKSEKDEIAKPVGQGEDDTVAAVPVEGDGERKKKRQRGKKKSLHSANKTADGQPRFVLFVGNLPFKITVEAIQAHFTPCGETPTVRLLSSRPSPNAPPTPTERSSRTKGCAFIEFTLVLSLQAALRLHESEIEGRKINVELTAGGGGNSDARKGKLEEKRTTLTKERIRTKINKAEREGIVVDEFGNDPTLAVGTDKSVRWNQGAAEEAEPEEVRLDKNGKKVRDRRLKKGVTTKPVKSASSGANAIMLG